MTRDRRADESTFAEVVRDLPPPVESENVEYRRVGPGGEKLTPVGGWLSTKPVRRWLNRRDAVELGIERCGSPSIDWTPAAEREETLRVLVAQIASGHGECDPVGHFCLYKLADGRHAVVFEEWVVSGGR